MDQQAGMPIPPFALRRIGILACVFGRRTDFFAASEIPRRPLRYSEGMATESGSAPQVESQPGPRMVFCVKLQRELPGLAEVPFEGHPLGQRIYENVSEQAWKLWLEQMKLIMNEYRLNLGTPEAQQFLLQLMEQYFFGQGAALPPDYLPPDSKA
jgi:Fe-S cluster biosynthesis and repair protein YggX